MRWRRCSAARIDSSRLTAPIFVDEGAGDTRQTHTPDHAVGLPICEARVVIVLRWFWIGDILLACADLDAPRVAVFVGVSVVDFGEAVIAAEVDRVQREGLDLN
jgi:hypothetical protein